MFKWINGFFDFNGDGKIDSYDRIQNEMEEDYEKEALHKMEAERRGKEFDAESAFAELEEQTEDFLEEEEEREKLEELEDAGLDYYDLEMMDEDERAEALEDAGLCAEDYDIF